jgi:RNA polymerase sigma-70 factor (ECF subfamily)
MSVVSEAESTDLPGEPLVSQQRCGQPTSGQSFPVILAEAREGSQASLGKLLDSTRKYLLTLADGKLDPQLKCKVGASDLVQDTFIEAQRAFERFHGATERELLTWLAAILANRCSAAVRRHRLAQKRVIAREITGGAELILDQATDGIPTPGTNLVAQEEQRRLHIALARLPATEQEILKLRIWQRASFAEVGSACGCSAEAARKRFLRAVEELQAVLEQSSPVQ